MLHQKIDIYKYLVENKECILVTDIFKRMILIGLFVFTYGRYKIYHYFLPQIKNIDNSKNRANLKKCLHLHI